MKRYSWIMYHTRRDILSGTIFLTLLLVSLFTIASFKKILGPDLDLPTHRLLAMTALIGVFVFWKILMELFPPAWGTRTLPSGHVVRYTLTNRGWEDDVGDIINSPEFKKHLDAIKRLDIDDSRAP